MSWYWSGFSNLTEHVRENALDRLQTAHLVERILEIRITRVVLGKTGHRFRAQALEEGHQGANGRRIAHCGRLLMHR
jgi:hypothetical protein